jgi:ArsR family transcriptional regulator
MVRAATASSIDLVFQACADRTRLRILNLLLGGDELCVCTIIAVLRLPQAKVSRHLAVLRKAGLVLGRKDGLWVHYRLAEASGTFHRRMLDCLQCCWAEVPELQRDLERLKRVAGIVRAPAGCCDDTSCG